VLVAFVFFAVPLVLYVVYEARQRHLAHRLELFCECGVLLAEPGGPAVRRGVQAASKDLEHTRKSGTCWNCGRRVWHADASG
jgi:hypothetical protein